MKPLKLPSAPVSELGFLATRLIAAIGSNYFAQALLSAVEEALPASHCTIFALQSNGRVKAVSSASAVGEAATITAVQYMGQGFDQQDSNMRWLKTKRPTTQTQLWIGQQMAEEVADAHYRLICYGEVGIRERLSVLALMPDGYRVAMSFYRNYSFELFTAADSDWLSRYAALIASCVHRHSQLVAVEQPHSIAGHAWLQHLSGREREVVSLIIAGHTTEQAAQAMGIALTTALTYRYRAFQHLGVRNMRELLAKVNAAKLA